MKFETMKIEHDANRDEAQDSKVEARDELETHGGLTREELRAIVVEMIG